MRYTVYKSLDKPSSLFGLRGTYLRYAIIGIIVAAMISFIVGGITNGLVGMILFIILIAVVYIIVLRIQAKFSERERTKWFCAHVLPDYIIVPPKRLSAYARVRFREKAVSK